MNLNFSQTITKSGVPLWTLTLPHSNSVAVGVLVFTGTRDEIWPQEAGIAHALEHMHFQGTESFLTSQEVAAYIEETGGSLNAWTWKEMTFYYSQVPADYADRAVYILSEQLRKSLFPDSKIQIEMKNIVQEIRRKKDNPREFVQVLANQHLYNNHFLSRDTLGTEESVLSFKKENFVSFKKRYYNPVNYNFIIAGKINPEKALNLFNKHFPLEEKMNSNERINQELITLNTRQLIKNKDIEQVHLVLSASIGKASEKNSLYLDFFRDMISGGSSFPLFQEIRDKRGLCYTVFAGINKWSDIGRFYVYIGTDPKRYREAINATLEVIEKSKSDEKLLEKVKNMKIGDLTLAYEDTGRIINIAARDIAVLGEPKDYEKIVKEIKEVDIDDIEKAVDKYLKPELIFTTMLAPLNFKDLA